MGKEIIRKIEKELFAYGERCKRIELGKYELSLLQEQERYLLTDIESPYTCEINRKRMENEVIELKKRIHNKSTVIRELERQNVLIEYVRATQLNKELITVLEYRYIKNWSINQISINFFFGVGTTVYRRRSKLCSIINENIKSGDKLIINEG